jgi:hypothetical protein
MYYSRVSIRIAHHLFFLLTDNLFVSLNIKKDGDAVTIFTKTAVQTTQDVHLTEGGMLLIALLSGRDYDTVSSLSSQACFAY